MLTLSHTKKELYKRCPMAYYIHYVLKLREKKVGSALPFGSAIDSAQEILLQTRDIGQAKEMFIEKWSRPVINTKVVTENFEEVIRFSKSDLDLGLFEKDEEATPWESLKRKGLMLLDGYNEQVMPLIKEVIGTQVKVSMKNSAGDEIVGYIDGILQLKLENNPIVITDNKTSSVQYKEDILQTIDGAQVALYGHMANEMGIDYDLEGYIVLDKKIRKTTKTGPRVRTQVIVDKAPKSIVYETLDDFNNVLYNIKMGRFESNSPNCDTYFGKCPCTAFIESDGTNYDDFVYVGRK